MKTEEFRYRTRINAPAEEVFRWHARPGAFERLTPPWESVEVVERTGSIQNGDRLVLRMHLGPVSQKWVAEHRDYVEGRQFRDIQREGPFPHWEHTHRFEPDGPTACFLEDRIEYKLPLGKLGHKSGHRFVRRKLERLFRYRHEITAGDVAAHTRYATKPLKVLLSGATGLVGSVLIPFLTAGGHQVIRLVRGEPRPDASEVQWDPMRGVADLTRLEGMDAVVHLAGENIASGRWTAERKARIRESRVRGTKVLSDALSRLVLPPKVFISASAVGYYGDRGDELLHEGSTPGENFLADICQAWEAATESADKRGIRVVHLRIGLVLSGAGGALTKMLLPFKLGVGGTLGSGRQYVSWVSIDDLIGIIHHVLLTDALRGAVNAVSPYPITNSELTKVLGIILHRPTLLPTPAFALRMALGREMASDLLLSSARIEPRQLLMTQYPFRHPYLGDTLRHILGKTS
ncbi:MAG: TIGR01777 family protein [Deltaproteobacteria bacterium]|nr:TIGR01777 family protein [Deltaproteobacteria bacterium]